MAIYSLNIKIQSRGKGKSVIAAAAYIAGERFKNEYDGIVHDRTDRKDVVHSEIVLPENAPEEFYDRAVLWNTVELSERAKNAQLARAIRVALPKEFTLEQNIKGCVKTSNCLFFFFRFYTIFRLYLIFTKRECGFHTT